MKKFSELQVNDYIFECCDDFPRMTVAYRITSINKGSTQTILLMKEFGRPECIRHLYISNNELDQCKHITSGFCNHNYWFQTEWIIRTMVCMVVISTRLQVIFFKESTRQYRKRSLKQRRIILVKIKVCLRPKSFLYKDCPTASILLQERTISIGFLKEYIDYEQ